MSVNSGICVATRLEDGEWRPGFVQIAIPLTHVTAADARLVAEKLLQTAHVSAYSADQRYKPPRLAVDGNGFVWRVAEDGTWSTAHSNPGNYPVAEPVTYYLPEYHPVEGITQ